jgi:hypothetical protein
MVDPMRSTIATTTAMKTIFQLGTLRSLTV